MKATDLMIGDLVSVHFGEFAESIGSDVYGHVSELYDNEMIEVACYNSPSSLWNIEKERGDEVRPIPLTPEILEKNFGKPYPRGGFHNYRMEKDETIAFVIEDRRVSAAPDNRVVFCRVPGTYICDVNYVHELQHALRLCGIDKEITL